MGMLLRCYAATWRYRVAGWPAFAELIAADERIVGAMFHGRHLALWGYISRAHCRDWSVMVSHSKDGDFLSSLLKSLGWKTIRGSSGRSGAHALKAATDGILAGKNRRICMAVDGSRGPIYTPKVGVLSLASNADSWFICATACPDRAYVLHRAWDRTRIPLPWSQITLAVTSPIRIPANMPGYALKRLLPKLEQLMRRQKEVVDRRATRRRGDG